MFEVKFLGKLTQVLSVRYDKLFDTTYFLIWNTIENKWDWVNAQICFPPDVDM